MTFFKLQEFYSGLSVESIFQIQVLKDCEQCQSKLISNTMCI